MRVKDFPYGKITKTLKKAVQWLNRNQHKIKKTKDDIFDWPDYWDMPKVISSRLSSDEVDFIQDKTFNWIYLRSKPKVWKTCKECRTVLYE